MRLLSICRKVCAASGAFIVNFHKSTKEILRLLCKQNLCGNGARYWFFAKICTKNGSVSIVGTPKNVID